MSPIDHRIIDGLHVLVHGPANAPVTILFLHHFGGTGRIWNSTIHNLLEANPSFRAIAYDSRGWGSSTKPEDRAAYTANRLAEDALNVIEGVTPLSKHLVIVGHSMGGKVAQLAAARCAARAKANVDFPSLGGLVLISPGPAPALFLPEEISQWILHFYDSPDTVQATVDNALSAHGWDSFSEEVRTQIMEDSLSGSALAKEAWVRDGIPEDAEKEVVAGLSGAGKVPTLVINGELDKLHALPMIEGAASKLEGADLVISPGLGHLIPLEGAEQFAKQLSSFIDNL